MAIHVQCGSDRGVPEPGLHDSGMGTELDHEASRGVTQAVEREPLQVGSVYCWEPYPLPEQAPTKWTAFGRGEHQVARLSAVDAREVFRKQLHQEGGDRDRSTRRRRLHVSEQ